MTMAFANPSLLDYFLFIKRSRIILLPIYHLLSHDFIHYLVNPTWVFDLHSQSELIQSHKCGPLKYIMQNNCHCGEFMSWFLYIGFDDNKMSFKGTFQAISISLKDSLLYYKFVWFKLSYYIMLIWFYIERII